MAGCLQDLKDNGITPISVDGIDRWPVQRYIAMMPFRMTGNEYIISLRDGKASMGDETGRQAVEFLQEIGQYFNEASAQRIMPRPSPCSWTESPPCII
mgnify:CR=1 FL=1